MRCVSCPVAAGLDCLGETHAGAFGHFCRWAREGVPAERELVVLRSALGYTPPAARPPGDGPAPAPAIPLAGDLVEALTRRLGADRAAKWVASKLGRECGCAERREKLNELDAKLRGWLSRET